MGVQPLPYGIDTRVRVSAAGVHQGVFSGPAIGYERKSRGTTLKEAIMLAAAAVGKELSPDDEDGLVGYLKIVAKSDIKAFASLLGRVLPMEISGANGSPLEVVFRTIYEDATKPSR